MLYTFSFCSCMHAAYSSLQSTFRFLLAVPAHRIEIRVYSLLQFLLFLVSLCSFRSCSVTVSPFDYCLLFLQFLVSLSVLLSSQYFQTHLISLFFQVTLHLIYLSLCYAMHSLRFFVFLFLLFISSLLFFSLVMLVTFPLSFLMIRQRYTQHLQYLL